MVTTKYKYFLYCNKYKSQSIYFIFMLCFNVYSRTLLKKKLKLLVPNICIILQYKIIGFPFEAS